MKKHGRQEVFEFESATGLRTFLTTYYSRPNSFHYRRMILNQFGVVIFYRAYSE